MHKNILIFSDGTGQAGGLRPDQRLSNVYKLYRASRTGPDSKIDPAKQIAFYETGLGSAEISGPAWLRPFVALRKILQSAFGTGLLNNVADCYEAVLRVYQPGDRIYLFGFSRGAYTVRSLAGVMNLCGVPTKGTDGKPIPRSGRALRKIVDEAVHTVYEHGAGHPRSKFEAEREEQARRFREKYETQDDPKQNNRGDVVPYFIGVFDTVAALGSKGVKRWAILAGVSAVILGVIAALTWIANYIFDFNFWYTAASISALLLVALVTHLYKSHVKVISDFPEQGKRHYHWAAWRFEFYDRFLDKRVRYARHAQAIDELRADFARVEWGRTVDMRDAPADWLVQTWFAGNHSDIGGSYPETESRLSDIALEWMVQQLDAIPFPILIDREKLNMFPDFAGPQHCEVESFRDLYPSWIPDRWKRSWDAKPRPDINFEDCHPTVLERFKIGNVISCGVEKPYQPACLRNEPKLAQFYKLEKI
jgi:uncharacterized protein (DUF2235 family)